jgi:hypothetical protein
MTSSSRATIALTIQRRAVIVAPSQLLHSYGLLGSMSATSHGDKRQVLNGVPLFSRRDSRKALANKLSSRVILHERKHLLDLVQLDRLLPRPLVGAQG